MKNETEARLAALSALRDIVENKGLPPGERGMAASTILGNTCGCPCHFDHEDEDDAEEEFIRDLRAVESNEKGN
jgi:hypothetical protein